MDKTKRTNNNLPLSCVFYFDEYPFGIFKLFCTQHFQTKHASHKYNPWRTQVFRNMNIFDGFYCDSNCNQSTIVYLFSKIAKIIAIICWSSIKSYYSFNGVKLISNTRMLVFALDNSVITQFPSTKVYSRIRIYDRYMVIALMATIWNQNRSPLVKDSQQSERC